MKLLVLQMEFPEILLFLLFCQLLEGCFSIAPFLQFTLGKISAMFKLQIFYSKYFAKSPVKGFR
jgi:hypothetical protein